MSPKVFDGLIWQDDRVLMGDTVLRLEHAYNGETWDLGEQCLRFYKTKALVDQYQAFFRARPDFKPAHILEIGIWDGGSTAFWVEQLKPEKLIAADLWDREDSPYFRDFLQARGLEDKVKTFWKTDQADTATLRAIVDRELDGRVDLVIDDGSHIYASTRASFEAIFPMLPPGGLYIIEDWAWEHWPECQGADHPFATCEGLTDFVVELVQATGSSKTLVASLTVFEGMVIVERGPQELDHFSLSDEIVHRPLPARGREETVKAIAFYLPQFHPVAENDRWWGKGYTEWTRTARAFPKFEGHYQPHVPERLGYYDLRHAQTRIAQAQLAQEYGIYGFCYHHYWFGGRRLLERPFSEVLASGEPNFPFCICWANENWTRRWDGAEQSLLVRQIYSEDDDRAFIEDLIPAFKDSRYIRVGDAPMLVIYRPGALPDPLGATRRWREICREHGIPRLHLVAAMTFGLTDPRPLGFDAGVEFPPHGFSASPRGRPPGVDPKFRGSVVSFAEEADIRLAQPRAPYRLYRTAMAGWDNTPRLGDHATVFDGASPETYGRWLSGLVAQAVRRPPDERIVFVNAWNEWGEGAHLEPDQHFGLGYLEATRRALRPTGRTDVSVGPGDVLIEFEFDETRKPCDLGHNEDSRELAIGLIAISAFSVASGAQIARFSFGDGCPPNARLIDGFADPEPWGVWSVGSRSVVMLALDMEIDSVRLEIDHTVLGGEQSPIQTTIRVNKGPEFVLPLVGGVTSITVEGLDEAKYRF